MGYTDQVQVTGLPRFDNLTRVHTGNRRILLMPTWRTYLVSPSYQPGRLALQAFGGSRYERFLHDLPNDPELHRALEQHAVTLEVLPHYEVATAVQAMASQHPRISISHHDDRDVQQAIRECDLLVTDWSSTFFDAAWMGTPVVLTPFDEEEFREHQYPQGYFDLERDGFGPVARTSEQAVRAIKSYIEADFAREAVYDERVRSFFAFTNRSNSVRTVAAIRRVLS